MITYSTILTVLASFVVFVISCCIVIHQYLRKRYRFWKGVGINGPEPVMIFGNMKSVYTLKQTEPEYFDEVYKNYQNEKYVGIYNMWKPTLFVRDLDVVRKITETDFHHFYDHPKVMGDKLTDTVFASLIAMQEEVWKTRRQYFAKLFTPKKLKEYAEQMNESMDCFFEDLEEAKKSQGEDVDLDGVIDRLAVRYIVKSFYGINPRTNEDIRKKVSDIGKLFSHPYPETAMKFLFFTASPKLYNFFRMTTFPKEIWDFYSVMSKGLIDSRKQNGDNYNDLVTMVIKLIEEGGFGFGKITFPEAVGHLYSFALAAHHTTLLTIGHILVQLSLHRDVQKRAQDEVDGIIKGSDAPLTYEQLKKMAYVEAVMQETLRLYTLVGIQKRTCTKEYKLDDNFTIPKGMDIFYSANNFHLDPQFFPDPLTFNPDRFFGLEKLPPAFMGFGKGPRICIGIRFAELTIKTTISKILSKFDLEPSKNMKLPMKFDPRTLFITNRPYDGLWVKFKPRQKTI